MEPEANYTPTRRTVVGVVVAIAEDRTWLLIDVGVGKVAKVMLGSETERSGGELAVGKNVEIRTSIERGSGRVAETVEILDNVAHATRVVHRKPPTGGDLRTPSPATPFRRTGRWASG